MIGISTPSIEPKNMIPTNNSFISSLRMPISRKAVPSSDSSSKAGRATASRLNNNKMTNPTILRFVIKLIRFWGDLNCKSSRTPGNEKIKEHLYLTNKKKMGHDSVFR